MLEVADIVRLHGAEYCRQSGVCLSSVQKRALRDIAACRTPLLGGHVHQCDHCQEKVYSYHSCRNRSCPKCHQDQTDRWIEKQRGHLLPCSYFLVTFTLPAPLRSLARSHPKKIYGLLMKAAADALQKLANDPRYLGGTHRRARRSAHLDPRHAVPSSRPHARYRRWSIGRCFVDRFQTPAIPGSRSSPVGDLSREILRGVEEGGIA
jgi:hypothetical protein